MTQMTTMTKSLWERYQQEGDHSARKKLLDQYLGLVHHVVRQILSGLAGAVELDDLVSAGTLGLVLALEGFDLERGLAFSTYATPRIRGAILDELRSRDWVPRSVRSKNRRMQAAIQELEARGGCPAESGEVAAVLGIDLSTYWKWQRDVERATLLSLETSIPHEDGDSRTLEDMLGDPGVVEPTEALSREEEIAGVRDAIADLPSKDRTVLALYYYEELNLRQIAEVLHLTESRISQIRTQALKRLRGKLRAPVER